MTQDINKNDEIRIAIDNYIKSLSELKRLNVIKNQKDFTSQIGEWISSIIYDGIISTNGKQKDWDMIVNGQMFQIKTHAKSLTSQRKDTDFKYPINSNIDFVIIIIFNQYYKLEKIFKVPFHDAFSLVNRSKSNLVLKWSNLDGIYSENLENIFLKHENLQIFKK